jgi:carbamoyltransferase
LLCAAESGELMRSRLGHAYWGPEYSTTQCEAAVQGFTGLRYERVEDLTDAVAGMLATGNVVGWFQGRMELGPRALGNRSILADPRRVETRDRVNRIKGRESWRPLAPAVLAEQATAYFCRDKPSPFMLFASQVREEKRSEVPAVVHIDGSARPQTVSREANHLFHKLIGAFQKHAGVPMLLNTSFNAVGEPIVCTPSDAVRAFSAMRLDLLVLGNLLVTGEK